MYDWLDAACSTDTQTQAWACRMSGPFLVFHRNVVSTKCAQHGVHIGRSEHSTESTQAEANTARVRNEDQHCDCSACNSPSRLWSSQNDTSESCPRRPRNEDQCTHPPPLSPKRKKADSEKRDSNRNRIRRKNCVYFISGHAQKLRVGLPKAPEVERSHEDGSEQRKTGELSEALWEGSSCRRQAVNGGNGVPGLLTARCHDSGGISTVSSATAGRRRTVVVDIGLFPGFLLPLPSGVCVCVCVCVCNSVCVCVCVCVCVRDTCH